MCSRGNVQSGKYPLGEIATRTNVWSGKCQVGEVSVWELSSRGCQSGKCPAREVSGQRFFWSENCTNCAFISQHILDMGNALFESF